MSTVETSPEAAKLDLAGFGNSKGAAALLNGLQILVSAASALSLVNWASIIAPAVAILGMVAGAVLQLTGSISSKALSFTVLISAAALGVGLYKVYGERGTAPHPPFIMVRAFNDVDGDGSRGTYERFLSGSDKVMVRFSPERSRSEAQLLDGSASFNKFDAGETVTVQVCGIDKDVKTFAQNDRHYSNMFNLEFAVPARQTGLCES